MSISGQNCSASFVVKNGKVRGKQCYRCKAAVIILCQETVALSKKQLQIGLCGFTLWCGKGVLWIVKLFGVAPFAVQKCPPTVSTPLEPVISCHLREIEFNQRWPFPDFAAINSQGFKDFLLTMRRFLAKYHRPVICIHGDSHYFRIDNPLVDDKGISYLPFTRVEVFGWPNVAGLSISVDLTSAGVFTYHPYY